MAALKRLDEILEELEDSDTDLSQVFIDPGMVYEPIKLTDDEEGK